MHPTELQSIGEKELARQATFRCRLHCCTSTACLASGGAAALTTLRAEVAAAGLEKETEVSESGCMGLCSLGPVVRVTHTAAATPATETLYQVVTPAVATAIVRQDVRHGAVVEPHELPADIPFFTRQKKVVLVNAGRIDPDSMTPSPTAAMRRWPASCRR
jgi:bidirectional [NiFe] hydrogenase diaphorase subunit